jgi:type I restriction enzyme R subunit
VVDKAPALIDFDTPANNRYLAVRELWVRGSLWLRRPDVVGFVNGLPLVFIELKRFEVHIDSAYKKNYADYLDTIPHLFHWNALVVISNGHDAQYGSITIDPRALLPLEAAGRGRPGAGQGSAAAALLLEGMLDIARLLDIVENFVLFDASEGSHPEDRGAQPSVPGREPRHRAPDLRPTRRSGRSRAGQLGVFWHTQGSGKSYSMVFLTEKIIASCRPLHLRGRHRPHRAGRPDRRTYTNCRPRQQQDRPGQERRRPAPDAARPEPALRVRADPEVPRAGGRAVFERDDIIVISDEAHRTQYGRLALNMRKGLPRAKFLGFTGTPLIDDGEKQLTREVFGDYVSIYDFQRAVADGATCPCSTRTAGEKLKIIDPKVSERIAAAHRNRRQAATLTIRGPTRRKTSSTASWRATTPS